MLGGEMKRLHALSVGEVNVATERAQRLNLQFFGIITYREKLNIMTLFSTSTTCDSPRMFGKVVELNFMTTFSINTTNL